MSCLDYIFLSKVEEKVICILTSFRETIYKLSHPYNQKKKKVAELLVKERVQIQWVCISG